MTETLTQVSPALRLRRQRRGLNSSGYTVALVLSDYLVSWISFAVGLAVLALGTRNSVNHLDHFADNLQHAFWFPIGVVFGYVFTGQYRLSRRSSTQSTFTEFKEYAMSACVGAFMALAMSYAAHHFGKWAIQVSTQVIVATVVASFLLSLSRATLRHVVLARRPQRVAVVDDGTNYERIATHLHLQHGIELTGRIHPDAAAPADTLGSLLAIDVVVAAHEIDRIVFGNVSLTKPEVLGGLPTCDRARRHGTRAANAGRYFLAQSSDRPQRSAPVGVGTTQRLALRPVREAGL
jgi:hypothetical protein